MGAARKRLVRRARITQASDAPAPPLPCPSCDMPLTFLHSLPSGVNPPERWDQYACRRCGGSFEYRQRTRVLRRTA